MRLSMSTLPQPLAYDRSSVTPGIGTPTSENDPTSTDVPL